MCGIVGVVLSSRSHRSVDSRVVDRMRDSLHHRGPDAAGSFVEPGVGLGHRRLSIIDVAHGGQPMESADGALQLVYNGEIYNHPTLRAENEARGIRDRTSCDTETLLHVFAREREETPRYLRGMFAYAVWDRRTRELFLARDRFGVKPLYYALTDEGSLYFGSEIKAILAAGVVAPALEAEVLPDYLANHAPSGDATLFAGIRRLPAGHTLHWRDGVVRIRPYWDLSFGAGETAARPERELIAEYAERFREAVRLRLMSDVPLGMFLSGGIDSASITAVMSDLMNEPVKTFSVAFAEREANELHYARLVAARFRTEHREVVVRPRQFFAELPKLVWHEDEPLAHPSSVALYFVSRLAAEDVRVVLTGEGSDETLAGYNRYRATVYQLALGARYERATSAPVRAAVRRAIERLPLRSRVRQKLSRTFLCVPADLTSLYFDNFAVFSRRRQADLMSPALRARLRSDDPYAAIRGHLDGGNAHSLLHRLLYADTKTYLHELLMKQDQMSMAASIESRVPFLDHSLAEFAAGLPERMKLRGLTTKYLLRQAMRGILPPEILTRRKMGFPVPIGRWLRGEFTHLLDEYVTSPRALARGLFDPTAVRTLVEQHRRGEWGHAERLWSLVNLEMWQRLFLDGEPAERPDAPSRRLTPPRQRLATRAHAES